MRHVAEKCDVSLEELYQQIGWPAYDRYGHAFDGFKVALQYLPIIQSFNHSLVGRNPETFWESLDPLSVSEDVRRELLRDISRRMTPQKVKIRAGTPHNASLFNFNLLDL